MCTLSPSTTLAVGCRSTTVISSDDGYSRCTRADSIDGIAAIRWATTRVSTRSRGVPDATSAAWSISPVCTPLAPSTVVVRTDISGVKNATRTSPTTTITTAATPSSMRAPRRSGRNRVTTRPRLRWSCATLRGRRRVRRGSRVPAW
ncbi:Uncharacterised protein [Mycobacteroides abscessus subsp. abscessus]|nr:Uncharacterised protein [Mycobacteroides abscessus subsp. abscessus]